ncbi:uncharacterized protein LOC115141897 [Oncorhynchus nerka]|uniref:uncharacterized protein LOC115141897 n=1 Tax=Oncorhynchus nerka TaxID=8023 RepID=UPI00113035C0|nr:uncharacterized protein LOC115141897 [Oncorhynchus nerka]
MLTHRRSDLTDHSLHPQNPSHVDPVTAHPGVTLETSCSPEGPAEGECCRSCTPPSAPPPRPPMPTMGVTTLEGVEVCQDGEDFCLTTEGGMEALGAQESSMGEMSPQRNNENRLPFQIFPEPVEVSLSPEGSPNHLQQFSPSEKERLPSIMVEPTDMSEVESGELRWPPEDMEFCSEEDDLFLEQCIPPANIADWGEEEEEKSVVINHQQNTSLIDLQSDAFRDETPILPPSSSPALN